MGAVGRSGPVKSDWPEKLSDLRPVVSDWSGEVGLVCGMERGICPTGNSLKKLLCEFHHDGKGRLGCTEFHYNRTYMCVYDVVLDLTERIVT